jgi:hypothetical protein
MTKWRAAAHLGMVDGDGQSESARDFILGYLQPSLTGRTLNGRDHGFFLGDLVDEFLAGVEVLVYQPRGGVGQPLCR